MVVSKMHRKNVKVRILNGLTNNASDFFKLPILFSEKQLKTKKKNKFTELEPI